MRVTFQFADFDALTDLWRRYFPEPYLVGADLIRQNTVESPLFDWGASAIDVRDDKIVGFVAVKKAAGSLYTAPGDEQAHLSAIAYDEADAGIDLLAHAKRVLRNRGVEKLVFGQDNGHFFPGCPSDATKLKDMLIIEGFVEGAESVDLEHDLTNYVPPIDVDEVLRRENAWVRRCSKIDLPLLDEFLAREFPARWRYDTLRKLEAEGEPSFVVGLFTDGKCEGFAITQWEGHRLPIGGAVWNQSLGEGWCSLGPIGVSKVVRGRGLGDAVLAGALLDLKSDGLRRCLIDWTNLSNWYGKHGFEIARRYTSYSLALTTE